MSWCCNVLYVHGRTISDATQFAERVKGENSAISLDKLIPCPEELKVDAQYVYFSEDEVENERRIREIARESEWGWTEECLNRFIEHSNADIRRRKRRLALYGFDNQYDFQLAKWGVKYDIHESCLSLTEDSFFAFDFYSFQRPPIAWLRQIAPLFPCCRFLLYYHEYLANLNGHVYAHRSRFGEVHLDHWKREFPSDWNLWTD